MSTESVEHRPKNVLDEAVNQGNLVFAVAAIGNSEGQLWAHAAGHRDINQRHTATSDNIIQIASMTKLVTSIAALQLVERGLLALDEPADIYLAELAKLRAAMVSKEEQDSDVYFTVRDPATGTSLGEAYVNLEALARGGALRAAQGPAITRVFKTTENFD